MHMIIVGEDALHVLKCGTTAAVSAAAAEMTEILDQWILDDNGGAPGYFVPPFGCNCGRVGDRA